MLEFTFKSISLVGKSLAFSSVDIIDIFIIAISALILGIIVKFLGGSFLGGAMTFAVVKFVELFITVPMFGTLLGGILSIALMIIMLNFLAGLDSWLKSFIAVILHSAIVLFCIKYFISILSQ